MLSTILALLFTVLSLICMGFFFFGSLPLLVLNHDTPLDSNFIRGLFNVYYRALPPVAGAGALSYALAGQPVFMAVMAGVGAATLLARRLVLARMDAVRASLIDGADPAGHIAANVGPITRFRRLHIVGMLLNVAQLAALMASLMLIRL